MVPVFLLAGQSNMVGGGRSAELPAGEPVDALLFEDGAWRVPGWRERFGPEVGFAREMRAARPGMRFALCKVAAGGANLYYDWDPEGARGTEDDYRGPLYPRLLEAWAGVHAVLAAEGAEAAPTALVWMQGERDAVFEFMADAYATRWHAFVTRLRRDLSAPDLPVVVGEISPRVLRLETLTFNHAYRERVQSAQARWVAGDHAAALVPTRDLPQYDNLHYDTAGQLLLGQRFARACLELEAF